MVENNQLKKVSQETMRFMRGKYALDEVGNGKDKLTFRDDKKTLLTIYIRDGYYDFVVGQATIRVADLDALEKAKELIIATKEPNRKPFPKAHIHIANCGHLCDLCVHYIGKTAFSAEEMEYMRACCTAVYGNDRWESNCNGCHFPDCDADSAYCRKEKGIEKCLDCIDYSTCTKTAGWPPEIHTRTITASQVTWAILPYVKGQYGN